MSIRVSFDVEAADLPRLAEFLGAPPLKLRQPVIVGMVDPEVPTPEPETEEFTPEPDTTPDVDKTGIPWDERIHADAANKLKADGTWKRRRNISDELVAEVEAELRGTPTPTPEAPQEEAPPTPTPTPEAPQEVPTVSDVVADVVGTPAHGGILTTGHPMTNPPAPVATPPAEPTPTTPGITVVELVTRVNADTAAGKYTIDDVDELAKTLGADNFRSLLSKPELFSQVVEGIDALTSK